MKIYGKYALILALTVGCSIPGNAQNVDKPITLTLEGNTTLHIGELAELQIPSDSRYSQFRGTTGAGKVLAFVRRSGRTVLYRAVRVGSGVIVISPDVPNGECISCATLHYFVNVVPQK